MSDEDDDALGWLEDGDAEGDAAGGDEDEFQDALGWLEGEEEGGGGDGGGGGGDDAGLDWLGGGDDIPDGAPALAADDEEEEGANQSIFSQALDDFFVGLEEKEEKPKEVAEAEKTIVTRGTLRGKRKKPGQDQRVERVMNTLIKYLTRKDPVRESQLDTIFRLTVGRVVDPISAEVIIVYFLDPEGASHLAHLFYSKTLFKNHPGLEEKFNRSLKSLSDLKIPPGEGIVGRAVTGRKAITSLDASNDADFQNHLGKATGYQVRTMLTVPISDEDQVYGAVQVMNKDPNSGEEFFSYQDLKLLEEIGAYLGRIIHVIREPDLERTEEEIASYYARLGATEVFDCTAEEVYWDERLWEVIGKENIQKFEILPIKKLDSKNLQVVMVNPLDHNRRQAFEAASDLHIGEALVATPSQIAQVIQEKIKAAQAAAVGSDLAQLTAGFDETEKVDVSGDAEEESGPIIQLCNRIIEDAYTRGASDIHIEPYETFARVRYRVDGALQERMRFPLKALSAVASRIKIMSELDIAERRLPQDGKIKFKRYSKKGLDIDLRVATGPMSFGEKIVMRILAKGSIALGLDAMGFTEGNLSKYRWACKQPYGMILNVGPTGSGKTTTLYSGLSEVNDVAVNIQTAEDPIEYPLEGINQMQMHKQIGLDFSAALRCYMRMDPDIILVGEIRDLETAEIAIEASLTGHLLFSTLHTNDAAGTIARFVEMGIDPFMVSSSLLVVCAQRLLRRTCDRCRLPWEPTQDELRVLNRDPRTVENSQLFKAYENRTGKKTCPKCAGVGYKGRCGTHEVLSLDDELRHMINRRASTNDLKHQAVKAGMYTIFQDAVYKVKEGITDLSDVIARVKADEVEGQRQDEVAV